MVKSSRERHDWPGAPAEPTGELLSIAEIERRFGITRYQIFKWAKEEKLHVVPIGKRFKYPDWEVREILRELFGRLRTAA